MRSRYQGACFDRHIHLFMYNIINYCFKVMRTCNTHKLIKGGHGRPPLFCHDYPYQKSIPLSSIFALTLSSIIATNRYCPFGTTMNSHAQADNSTKHLRKIIANNYYLRKMLITSNLK